jgi:hypothetical protein
MPTQHRRLAIIRDEAVEQALSAARKPGAASRRSDAAVARDLLLRGARDLERERGGRDGFREWLAATGGTAPSGPVWGLIRELGAPAPHDPEDPYPGQRALRELREDRI